MATEAAWLNGNNLEKEEKEEERNREKNQRKALTLTGLLMEGVRSDSLQMRRGTRYDLVRFWRDAMSLLLYARVGPPKVVLPIVIAATLLMLGGPLAEQTQTNPASSYDPLQAFVGTWTATNPNETAPYMSLKFEETNGQLTGTISHFKIAVARSGQLLGTPADAGTSPIANIQVSDGDLDFVWAARPHGQVVP
jgi:hypothetical protein